VSMICRRARAASRAVSFGGKGGASMDEASMANPGGLNVDARPSLKIVKASSEILTQS
jgi:hypothetical protein